MLLSETAVGVRFSPGQMAIIWPGLHAIVVAHHGWRTTKKYPSTYPFNIYPPPRGFDRGRYDPDFMNEIFTLWRILRPRVRTGGRLQLNTIHLRAAMLAVRVHLDSQRHTKRRLRGLPAADQRRFEIDNASMKALHARSASVIRTLERHMKRANRRLKAEMSPEDYAGVMTLWKRHLRWIRLHLVYFRPWPRVSFGRKVSQQLILDRLVEGARRGLEAEGLVPPDDSTLRKVMRLYTQYVRRGRTRYAFYPLQQVVSSGNASWARYMLARFVSDRMTLSKRAAT